MRGEIDFIDLGHALNDVGDLLSELLADVNDGDGCILHGIMQKPGGDTDRIHLHLGQDQCYFERVNQIGLTGGAGLSRMVGLRKLIRPSDHFQIVSGPALSHGAQQIAEFGYSEDVSRDLLPKCSHWKRIATAEKGMKALSRSAFA